MTDISEHWCVVCVWVGVCNCDKDELWMMRSTGYVVHMGKKRNMYGVLVGIAEEWRLLVRWENMDWIYVVKYGNT
jgi:hypothetical protein